MRPARKGVAEHFFESGRGPLSLEGVRRDSAAGDQLIRMKGTLRNAFLSLQEHKMVAQAILAETPGRGFPRDPNFTAILPIYAILAKSLPTNDIHFLEIGFADFRTPQGYCAEDAKNSGHMLP